MSTLPNITSNPSQTPRTPLPWDAKIRRAHAPFDSFRDQLIGSPGGTRYNYLAAPTSGQIGSRSVPIDVKEAARAIKKRPESENKGKGGEKVNCEPKTPREKRDADDAGKKRKRVKPGPLVEGQGESSKRVRHNGKERAESTRDKEGNKVQEKKPTAEAEEKRIQESREALAKKLKMRDRDYSFQQTETRPWPRHTLRRD